MIRRKLIEDLGADPSPDDAYTALRGALTPLRRDEKVVGTLSPRERRVFPVLIDIAESGVRAALKTARVKSHRSERSLCPADPASIYSLAALRLIVIGILAFLVFSGTPLVFDPLFALAAVAVLILIEVTPFVRRWRVSAEWALLGRERRHSGAGRRRGDSPACDSRTRLPQPEDASAPAQIAIETSSFADHMFDVMISVDKALRLMEEPSAPQPSALLEDRDALSLMQDLIAARMDGDGTRALVLLRQIEPLLLAHGVSVHQYCPELAGMFTVQSAPGGSAPATLRPALAAGGRVVAAGVAEEPRPAEDAPSSRAGT